MPPDIVDARPAGEVTAGGGACANCGATLHGRYCHGCGQDAEARIDSMRGFLAENLSDLAHFDSRGLLTLRDLLFRPGRLTATYFEGRRTRYVSPIQLYLVAAALFFFANSVSPFIVVDGATGAVHSSLGVLAVGQDQMTPEERAPLEARGVTPELFEERFRSTVNNQLPAFLIGVVLAFGLLVALFHPRRERNLLKHAVFALHWTSFYLLLMITERLAGGEPGETSPVGLVLAVIALAWLGVALRRTYTQHWAAVVAKTFGLFLGFNLLLALWVATVMVLAMRAM